MEKLKIACVSPDEKTISHRKWDKCKCERTSYEEACEEVNQDFIEAENILDVMPKSKEFFDFFFEFYS